MKKIVLVIIILTLSISMFAQGNNVKPFEFEVSMPVCFPTWSNGLSYRIIGFHLEPRYNYTGKPYDVGVNIGVDLMERFINNNGEKTYHYYTPISLIPYFDYNIRRYNNISFFFGGGLGVSWVIDQTNFSSGALTKDSDYYFRPAISLRLGTEFFNHLRFTIGYNYIPINLSYFNIGLGIAFGGGYKKNL